MRTAMILLGAIGIQVAAAASGRAADVYALKGGTVFPVTGPSIPNAVVIIRDGVIEAVGPASSVEVPYDAQSIDAVGLFIYPGFIDARSKAGLPAPKPPGEEAGRGGFGGAVSAEASEEVPSSMPQALRRGLQPELLGADQLELDEASAKPYREQGLTSALVAPDAGILMGQSALVNLSGRTKREALVRNRVAIHAALRPMGGGYPGSLMGAIAYLRQTLLDARTYALQWQIYERDPLGRRRPPSDAALAALQAPLDGSMPVMFEANEKNAIERALRFSSEFGLRCMLNGALESHQSTALLRERDIPVVLSLNFPEEPKRKEKSQGKDEGKDKPDEKERREPGESRSRPDGGERGNRRERRPESTRDSSASEAANPDEPPSKPDEKPAEKPEMKAAPAENQESPADDTKTEQPSAEKPEDKKPDAPEAPEDPLPVFEEKHRRWEKTVRGAATLAQAGVRFAFQTADLKSPADFTKNLKLALEKGGLSREAALRALTIEPARMLGVDRQLGSIEPGKIANLAVFEGEFGDPKARLRAVYVDGIRFEEKAASRPPGSGAKPSGTDPTGLVAGTWDVTVALSDGGRLSSVLELKQSGSTLSGSLKSQLGEATVSSGTIDGSHVSITAAASFGGNSFEFVLDGTVEGDSMSGSIGTSIGPDSEFTATRRASPKGIHGGER